MIYSSTSASSKTVTYKVNAIYIKKKEKKK